MEKLMKKEIDHKYSLFVNNTNGIKPADILFSLREIFKEHFGAGTNVPLSTQFNTDPGPIDIRTSRAQNWFQIDNTKNGYLDFKMQFLALTDPQNPIIVRICEYGNPETFICPLPLFIKQYCNPEGVYLLEKAVFNLR